VLTGLTVRPLARIERKHQDFHPSYVFFDLWIWPAPEDELDIDEQADAEDDEKKSNWVQIRKGVCAWEEWGYCFVELPNKPIMGVRLAEIRPHGIAFVQPYAANETEP